MPDQPVTAKQTRQKGLVALVVGGRGTGKSTYLKKIVDKSAKKVLVFDIDENKIYAGMPTIDISEIDKLSGWKAGKYLITDIDYELVFTKIYDYVKDALIIIEDASKYIENQIRGDLKKMVLASKQRGLDIIFTFHRFKDVPKKLCSYSDFAVIFKTAENIRESKDRVPMGWVEPVWEEVKAHPSRFFNKTARLR
jgi:nucleoside-triphosphatase THEP1